MNISFWAQTWVDVDFLAVGKLAKAIFSMAHEAKRGRLTFSVYVIKRLTQKLIKNGKRKEVGIWKLKLIFFYF